MPFWSLRHSTSVTVEDSTTTDNTWIGAGKGGKQGQSRVPESSTPTLLAEARWFPSPATWYGPRIPCQVNHHLRGQATRVSNVLPSKRWRGWTGVGRVETRREPSGKHLAKGRECKRAHSGPLPLAKDNPSNQSSALEPATACLEGRLSCSRRSLKSRILP